LFLTWNGAGNQPPAIGVAQFLRHRGHEVIFGGYENQRSLFTARGFRFIPLQRSATAWRDEPRERMFDVKVQTAWTSVDHLEDVPQAIRDLQCDGALADCLMFGALAALEVASVPTAVLVHSAPGALLPPGGQFEAVLREPVNRMRGKVGLPAIDTLWDAWKPFPALCTSVRELDPLAAQAPASLHYLGPIGERIPPSGWVSPWAREDDRPLILVSFSTGPYWDQSSRIRRTIDALANRNCRVLVTTGMVDAVATSVPGNVVMVTHIPHAEVLPHAAVTVTHAGHGTVAASLAHGVPLVCLPNKAADQPALAAHVVALGAGQALDGDTAKPAEIAAAVERVLTDPSYGAAARRVASAITNAPGPPAAAHQLEQLVWPAS
jgi:UDP:flavonoid glycosyltransferase YjiC (YdhE family)